MLQNHHNSCSKTSSFGIVYRFLRCAWCVATSSRSSLLLPESLKQCHELWLYGCMAGYCSTYRRGHHIRIVEIALNSTDHRGNRFRIFLVFVLCRRNEKGKNWMWNAFFSSFFLSFWSVHNISVCHLYYSWRCHSETDKTKSVRVWWMRAFFFCDGHNSRQPATELAIE